MDLPSGFITQMRGLLHEDADDFLAAMMREAGDFGTSEPSETGCRIPQLK